jgi:hypothetical protein
MHFRDAKGDIISVLLVQMLRHGYAILMQRLCVRKFVPQPCNSCPTVQCEGASGP